MRAGSASRGETSRSPTRWLPAPPAISVVHQEILICPDLTAAENVLLGHVLPKRAGLSIGAR